MTTFITIKHRKTGGVGRIPEQNLDHYKARGWSQIKDPDGLSPDSPHLPEQMDAESAAEQGIEQGAESSTDG